MGSSFDDLLAFVASKRDKINTISNDREVYGDMYKKWLDAIANNKNAYAKYLEDSQKELIVAQRDYEDTLAGTVNIRLGDILREYFKLANLDDKNAKVLVRPNIFVYDGDIASGEDMLPLSECIEREKWNNLEICISAREGAGYRVKECLGVPLEFEAIQGDGKTLYEHCYLENRGDGVREICLKGNVNDYICKFSIAQLLSETSSNSSKRPNIGDALIATYNSQDLVKQ